MGKRSKSKAKQKQRRIYESQVLPALPGLKEKASTLVGKYKHVIDPRARQDRDKLKGRAVRLQARLQDPQYRDAVGNAARLDTAASRPPNGYYVIVGRGAAATINHTTLRQSKKGRERLGALPVMHIGFEDPWLHYHPHGMGQPPYLLRMPGYHKPVALDAATIRSGLNSRLFAASTEAEMELLKNRFEVYVVTAWVACVLKQGAELPEKLKADLVGLGLKKANVDAVLDSDYPLTYPPYRVLIISPDASLRFVYAEKVDICNGAGQMNLANRDGVIQDAFKEAQSAPWITPAGRGESRKVVHGMDGLTDTWDATLRYCVCGSGGIALNQVERAHDVGNYLDWYATQFLHAATFGLERNDTVLKAMLGTTSTTTCMREGEARAMRRGPLAANFDTAFPLIPGSFKWRIGQQCGNPTVALSGTKMSVAFTSNENAFLFDFYANYVISPDNGSVGAEADKQKLEDGVFKFAEAYSSVDPKPAWMVSALNPKLYDRIILCMGQNPGGMGEPNRMTEGIVLNSILCEANRRLVGLQSEDERIRVLGAAAAAWPNIITRDDEGKAMETFRTTLPVSAVLPGFILSGVNIATANGFFDAEANNNVNSTSFDQLKELLMVKALLSAEELVTAEARALIADTVDRVIGKIVVARSWPNNGLANADALKAVLANEAYSDEILGVLSTDYRAADTWD